MSGLRVGYRKSVLSCCMIWATVFGSAQTEAPSSAESNAPSAEKKVAIQFEMPKSRNPLSAYEPSYVPEPQLTNSPLLSQLIRDGKLFLSLKDAIRLALENNLDLAIARYNLPIADTDILRTKAGGVFRGVNAGILQGTPGGWHDGRGWRRRRGRIRPGRIDAWYRHPGGILRPDHHRLDRRRASNDSAG
jgi:hypothetical protein